MANKDYNFQYTPLTGRLPGNSFVKQTEQAINELAGIVNDGAAQVEVITNLANTANANSEEALEKANEALETSGRVYITLPNLDDADDYFDSQLYYFANSYSHNLPVADTGFLEVKTNDTKTACEQVFIADNTGLCYFRHGVITATEVGDETVYSVTWETWSSELASQDYVQQEVNNEADRVDETFLPLSGGTLTGYVNGVTPTPGDNTTKLATTAYVQGEISVVNNNISAINTRLGTILTVGGSSTTVDAYATLCSITTHPAGVWLITSYMDLNYGGATRVYINRIETANHGNIVTRNTSDSGGGNCAVLLTALDKNEAVNLIGYQTQSGTMRGRLRIVQLA